MLSNANIFHIVLPCYAGCMDERYLPRRRAVRPMGPTFGRMLQASKEIVDDKDETETAPVEPSSAVQMVKRLVAVARDSTRGWPELAKRNPGLAEKVRAEHQEITRRIYRP
jgi:hypothetical protein